ncbi:FAD binding domain-containing protein [Histoplasma capsulatum var. duboisii H88]|uniref:FAD binding domain-containing protein n=1 Tax=Ajellomyces capsulatus (strain H88) TaxID=544711 RepID=F0UFK9_AJEC8|nr:FAD binding domain-containing protein [Histoplasma capsulatum var. duboisii H88]QSS55740.1 FAD binding domain-containing protein [Histoplasma capsulatum var. duboisii H88]
MILAGTLLSCAALYLCSVSAKATPLDCKCGPGDACWPSAREWQALNSTIDGKLIRAIPPASVCYKSQPTYDAAACSSILAQWHTSGFHLQDPISIDFPMWAGDSCPPIFENGTSVNGDPTAGKKGCSIGRHPVYVVNATGPEEVVTAVKWAGERNIRVNVKATGHSLTGRSTAEGSLSIWTRNIRSIKFHPKFQSASCPGGESGRQAQMAATVGAGEIGYDVIQELDKYGATAVTGGNNYVGLVGWLTGGGHGRLSSSYGMGSDNLIEANIITPTGKFLTVNACQHTDLFWAIRGGGGGTYGIITSVIIKAYPTPSTTVWKIQGQLLDKSKEDQWWDLMAYFYSLLPSMKQEGLQGYYRMIGQPFADTLVFVASFLLYDKPNGTAEALFEPFKQRLDELMRAKSVAYLSEIFTEPSFLKGYDRLVSDEPVAHVDYALGTWLLPAQPMEDVEVMAKMFKEIGPKIGGNSPLSTILNSCFVANSANSDLETALHPAWRKAVVHLMVISAATSGVSRKSIQEVRDDMTYNKMPNLKKIAPDSAAYFNEMDPFDPDWQNVAFGPNYKKLRAIKQKYDPDTLLWCFSCVGSEDWVEIEDGRLCRAYGGICPALTRNIIERSVCAVEGSGGMNTFDL